MIEPTRTDASQILDSALAVVETGVIVVDSARRVVLWNAWIERRTLIPANAALGRAIEEVFAGANITRLVQAVADVVPTVVPTHGCISDIS